MSHGRIHIGVGRNAAIAALAIFVVLGFGYGAMSETLSMNTYYPVPVGIYKKMTTTQQTILARDSGNVILLGAANGGGMVGIGTTSPVARLDVNGSGSFAGNISAAGTLSAASGIFSGGVQVGNDVSTCVPAKAGMVRWNGTNLQLCDGSSWKSLGVAAPSAAELCAAASGSWVSGPNVCYFSGSSCPAGWSASLNYSSTLAATCGNPNPNACGRAGSSCTTGSHYRQNAGPESCSGAAVLFCPSGGPCYCYATPVGCSASITEIGCSKNL